jgi:hypothetical protein
MLSDDFDDVRSIGTFFSAATLSKVLARAGVASWTKHELL